jgi:hypothetical protein
MAGPEGHACGGGLGVDMAHQPTQHQQVHPDSSQLVPVGVTQAVRSHRGGTKTDQMDAERVRERLTPRLLVSRLFRRGRLLVIWGSGTR